MKSMCVFEENLTKQQNLSKSPRFLFFNSDSLFSKCHSENGDRVSGGTGRFDSPLYLKGILIMQALGFFSPTWRLSCAIKHYTIMSLFCCFCQLGSLHYLLNLYRNVLIMKTEEFFYFLPVFPCLLNPSQYKQLLKLTGSVSF